jgi:hypothetical protein
MKVKKALPNNSLEWAGNSAAEAGANQDAGASKGV